ncbi:MAG: PqqD family protein [Clostridium sp.]
MSKKKKYDEKDNFLLYVPYRKHQNWEVKKGFVHLVFIHDKFAEKFLRWMSKKPTVSDMKFDRMGSCVWQSMDGINNVYEIGQKLLELPELKKEYANIKEEEYIDGCHPIYGRLIMFLRYMNKKGWARFKLRDKDIEFE